MSKKIISLATFITGMALSFNAYACTGIMLKANDKSVVFSRTLEFAKILHSDVIFIPQGQSYTGITPAGENGLKWENKYSMLGANFLNMDYLLDGFNEKGLYGGFFYFPGYAKYQTVKESDHKNTISEWQIINWALSNHETVSEVKNGLKKIKVANVFNQEWKEIIPIHIIFVDKNGDAIVVEYVDGKLNIYDNPFGVIANSPTFDWHVTNITNYLNLSTSNVNPQKIDGKEFTPFGQGSGLFGIPGDFTPPSRFIRALFFKQSSIAPENAKEGMQQAFHILNSFDIPKGSIRDNSGNVIEDDYTQWTSSNDLQGLKYYFKTENNSRVRVIDMKQLKTNSSNIIKVKMETEEDSILNISDKLK